jgi:glycosyltransferase involved in cell wall biosynthesis
MSPFQTSDRDIDHPAISVIIPTKDRRLLLGETLKSLSAQTLQAWEAVIVDDGSGDGTAEFVKELASGEPRFRYLARTGDYPGASACRNAGLSMARGKYVIFLDSDDLLAADCLYNRLQSIQQSECDYIVFQTGVFRSKPGDDTRLWNRFDTEDDLDRFLSHDMPWHTSGPIWKKSALDIVGPWDENCLTGQDWEFHIRALASGLRYTKVSLVDSFWRESRPGAISHTWAATPQLINRTALMIRVAILLREKGLLSPGRRRRIAAACHRNALEYCPDNQAAWSMWFSAWRHGVTNIVEFQALLVAEILSRSARKLRKAALSLLLPESNVRSSHLGSND